MVTYPALLALFYPAAMIFAGLGDLRTMRIPDYINLSLIAGYAVAAFTVQLPLSDVLWSIAAAIALFLFGYAAFLFRWMGGGDVKLLTAAALWLGAGNVPFFVFYTSIFGAILTTLVIIFRMVPLNLTADGPEWIMRLHRRDEGVPYGVAIAAAGILVYFNTPWVLAQF